MNRAFQKTDRAHTFDFRIVQKLFDSRGNDFGDEDIVRPRRGVQQVTHYIKPFHSDLSTGAGESGIPFDKCFPLPEWRDFFSILKTNRLPSRSTSLTGTPVTACRLKWENRLMKSRAITFMSYMMYDKAKN